MFKRICEVCCLVCLVCLVISFASQPLQADPQVRREVRFWEQLVPAQPASVPM